MYTVCIPGPRSQEEKFRGSPATTNGHFACHRSVEMVSKASRNICRHSQQDARAEGNFPAPSLSDQMPCAVSQLGHWWTSLAHLPVSTWEPFLNVLPI